jgi:hypothetical protein
MANKTLFDHINVIYQEQKKNYFQSLTDGDKKTYSAYMVNRFLSMNIHQLPLVNEIQKYSIPDENHYLFFATTIPRGKQYNKYVKAAKETKYEEWLVTLVAKHYCVSEIEAISYLEIYYRDNKSGLRELCEKYGIDPKVIKKAKL